MSKETIYIRVDEKLKSLVYKVAQNSGLSLNLTLTRMINHALTDNKLKFELQYCKKGDKFQFLNDIYLHGEQNAPTYKLENVHKSGDFVLKFHRRQIIFPASDYKRELIVLK